jgi:hypothetical protein
MSMNVNFIVEGETDRVVVTSVLHATGHVPGRITVAGGRNGLPSVGRSVLVRWPEPAVILGDADSNDPAVVRDYKASIESYVRWASPAQPFLVALAEPQVEAVLFKEPSWVARVVGRKLDAREEVEAKYAPHALSELLAKEAGLTLHGLLAKLTVDDWRRLAAHALFVEILEFVSKSTREDRQAGAA